jgi:hypothetical protein
MPRDRGYTIRAVVRGQSMPEFFDFLSNQGYDERNVARMNHRYRHVIEPHRRELAGARVLDLGSHDGRWSYALASAGAASVLGVEGRAELIAQYADFPASAFKDRVSFVCGDFVAEMDRLLAVGETFDVIACLGVYYHTMQHYRMLIQMTAFRPKLIILDSIFARSNDPVIVVSREPTDQKLNSIAQVDGQGVAPIGRVSVPALRIMAQSVGYSVAPVTWTVPQEQRAPVADYFFRFKDRVRKTIALKPVAATAERKPLPSRLQAAH